MQSKSASSSFSHGNATPYDSPNMSPLATPFDSPITTPSDSPVQSATDLKPLPRAEDIHLILSDCDGTILMDNHDIHSRTVDAIRYIRETRPEVPIIPVTGKQRVSCAPLIKELGISEFPTACLHGAIIYDKDGNIEQHSPLDPTFVLGVTELMKKHNKTTMLYVADWVAMASLEQGGTTDWEAVSRGFDPSIRDSRDGAFLELVKAGKEQIGKIFLPMDEEVVPQFLELLHTTFPNTPFKTTRALPYIIEIVAENVNKSMALAYFCDKYNVKPENVLSFGDGENDVEMLKASGYGVSMGNAMDAPRLAADYATGTNEEGGVGQFLDRVFRPTKPDAHLRVDHIKALDPTFAPSPLIQSS